METRWNIQIFKWNVSCMISLGVGVVLTLEWVVGQPQSLLIINIVHNATTVETSWTFYIFTWIATTEFATCMLGIIWLRWRLSWSWVGSRPASASTRSLHHQTAISYMEGFWLKSTNRTQKYCFNYLLKICWLMSHDQPLVGKRLATISTLSSKSICSLQHQRLINRCNACNWAILTQMYTIP